MRRLVWLLVMGLLASVLGTTPALAVAGDDTRDVTVSVTTERQDEPDMQYALEGASPDAVGAFSVTEVRVVEHDVPANVTDGAVISGAYAPAATKRCRTAYVNIGYNNRFKQRLWTLRTSQYWCWRSGTVVSRNTMRVNGDVSNLGRAVGWQYMGLLQGPNTDKIGNNYETYAQAKFSLRPPGFPTLDSNYPWLDLTLRGDGSYVVTYSRG